MYKKIKVDGICIDEHRFIMEQCLGRQLSRDEVVHHKNGDKRDNRIENLEVMLLSDHSRFHMAGNIKSPSTVKKLSNSMTGVYNGHANKPVLQYNKKGELLNKFKSASEAARCMGGLNYLPNITRVCNGERKTANKYIWKYKIGD